MPGWGMSLGVRWVDDLAWPFEVSLTRSPRFEDARVLGVGNAALARWELLTGAPVSS